MFVSLFVNPPLTAQAAQAATGVPQIDAVLVLDASNSMKTSDPDKISVEAMNMFIDMLGVAGDKVGVVSYSSEIERQKAVLTLRGAEDKADLKAFIAQLNYGSYTDITLGMEEAARMLDDSLEPGHKPMIVLLTDGNNEMDPGKSKTLDDAAADTERIISEAQAKGYPVYTIGLNHDGYLNRGYLEDIAHRTGAKFFETSSADGLPEILSAIFADQMELKIVNIDNVTADGNFQVVDLIIPDRNIVEANVTFLSGNPVEVELYDPSGNQVLFDGAETILTQSNSYSLLKIISPGQGLWQIRVKGVSGDQIKINLLYQYSVDAGLSVTTGSNVYAGDTIPAEVVLYEGSRPTSNTDLYLNSTCVLRVLDTAAQQETQIPAVYRNGVFVSDVYLPEARTYEITARVEHPNFFRESEPVSITAAAAPAPTATPTPTPQPTATPAPTATRAPTPTAAPVEEPSDPFPWYFYGLIGLGVLALVGAAVFVSRRMKRNARVFTGKLVIEVTDHYTRERSAPQYRNLIEYGKKTDLFALLNRKGSPALERVVITPSPDAPSHMPQLIVKCNDPAVKFKKDFMEQDASKGIAMNLKSELLVMLEAENKQVKIRYTE
jgi:Mg-chelatase subunit ChlD